MRKYRSAPRTRARPKPLRVERNYENELANAFRLSGFVVVDYPVWKRNKELQENSSIIVRQFMPKPFDPLVGKTRNYKMDFANPTTRCNMEFDGFRGFHSRVGGHTNWSGFHRDRYRDRLLLLSGWRIFRLGPDDVKTESDMLNIVREFIKLMDMVTGNG
jgi:hypothetical protein